MRLTPLFALAISLALGEALALVMPDAARLWPWMLGAVLLVILFGYGLAAPGWGFLATALLGVAVVWSALAVRARAFDAATRTRGPFVCEATLWATPTGHGLWRTADLSSDGLDLRVIFPIEPGARAPKASDRWRFAGWLERKGDSLSLHRKLWVKGTGTSAVCVRPAGRWSLARMLDRIRRSLSRRLGIGLDHAPDIADLNRAILLGERRGLDPSTRSAFAAAGTTHIFAISGLHVMCVAGLVFGILVVCYVPLRTIPLLLVPIVWGYVLLVGAAPSAVRAAAMASICLLAPVFWRRPDGLTAWSVVFIVVHLLRPLQLAHVGSCLSFVVMLTLILFSRWYREVVPSRRGEWLATSLAAWAAGVPIVAVVFGRFTPGAILANLVLLPAATFSVGASAFAVLVSFVSPTLAGYLNNAGALGTTAMVGVSRLTAALPGCSHEVAPWTPWECFAWYFVLVAGLYLVRSIVLRHRRTL